MSRPDLADLMVANYIIDLYVDLKEKLGRIPNKDDFLNYLDELIEKKKAEE